jgi:penicillin amidase
VAADPTDARTEAVALLSGFDGHFVDGDLADWINGTVRSDAWVLSDRWIREVIRLTFADELDTTNMTYADQDETVLFNTILHVLNGSESGVIAQYDWFGNLADNQAPQTAEAVILAALDNVLAELGDRPWNVPRSIPGEREIVYRHDILGQVHETPFGSRSTYAHCVEMGPDGPLRIESMFPLGQSGNISVNPDGSPAYDDNYFSMTAEFDGFSPRDFPVFD